jgi:hypothetical protein
MLMSNGFQTELFTRKFKSFLAPMIILVTFFALSLFPIAECIGCEGLSPWGRNDSVYALRGEVFNVWLIGTSLLPAHYG